MLRLPKTAGKLDLGMQMCLWTREPGHLGPGANWPFQRDSAAQLPHHVLQSQTWPTPQRRKVAFTNIWVPKEKDAFIMTHRSKRLIIKPIFWPRARPSPKAKADLLLWFSVLPQEPFPEQQHCLKCSAAHVNPCKRTTSSPGVKGSAHLDAHARRRTAPSASLTVWPIHSSHLPPSRSAWMGFCCQTPVTINSYQLWECSTGIYSTYFSKQHRELLPLLFRREEKQQRDTVMSPREAGRPVPREARVSPECPALRSCA